MNIRAWNVFQFTLLAAFVMLTASMAAAGALRLTQGELDVDQTRGLLRVLYWGSYPLVFLGLGSLAWHIVKTERGGYV